MLGQMYVPFLSACATRKRKSLLACLLVVLPALVGAAVTPCLEDAVPEENRVKINFGTATLPLGVFELQWTSAQLLTSLARIIAEEVLGFQTVISGGADGSLKGFLALSNCSSEDSDDCIDTEIADNNPHHATFEFWEQSRVDLPEARTPYAVDCGYYGVEGHFVGQAERIFGYADRGTHLDFYGAYDTAWNTPWDFFDSHLDIPTDGMLPCAETELAVSSFLDRVREFTPSEEAFNEDGTAYCPDGYWWISPACRHNVSRCIPMITGGSGWFAVETMQRAIAYSMPIAFGTASWSHYTSLPYEFKGLLYTWEPAMHFLMLKPEVVQFPRTDSEALDAGDSRTTIESTLLTNLFATRLQTAAPRLWATLTSISLSESNAEEMQLLYFDTPDLQVSACRWLLNNSNKIDEWVPISTKCSSGSGMVDSNGNFVADRSLATDCNACKAGRFSDAFEDSEGETFICSNCSAGTVEPMWGTSNCVACDVGYYMDLVGQSTCKRCPKGQYAEGTGNSVCTECPSGWTTDGTGFASPTDCQCPAGTFQHNSTDGDGTLRCVRCSDDETSSCAGFGAEPEAVAGYYLAEANADGGLSIFCCFSDAARCPGGGVGTCASGREGNACARCIKGTSPGNNGTCEECGEADYLPVVLAVTCFVLGLSAVYWHASSEAKTRPQHSALLVTIVFGQTLSVLQLAGIFSRIAVDWPDPMSTFISTIRKLTLEMDEMVRIGCWAPFAPATRYGLKISFILVMCVCIIILHIISTATLHSCNFRERSFALVGSIGVLVMALHISITGLILSPFQCLKHPNAVWTMTQYEDVICWESSEHTWMLAMGTLALSVPVSFLAAVIRLLWIFPHRIKHGDTAFLSTYSFLFARVKPSARWFMLAALSRGLTICVVAAIPDSFGQIFCMSIIFTASLLATILVMPWRIPVANYIDTFCHLVILGVLQVSATCLTDVNINGLSQVTFFFFVVLFAAAPLVLLISLLHRFCRGAQRPYRYFLSHQKSASGAFARLLKMTLETTNHTGGRVFLDSDNLVDLTKLFNHVREDVHTVLVLSTGEIFQSVWCLGEVAVAHLSQVAMVPLFFSDYVQPSDEFLASLSEIVSLKVLVENGISEDQITAAVRFFKELSGLPIPSRLDNSSMKGLCIQIHSAAKCSAIDHIAGKGEQLALARARTTLSHSKTSIGNFILADMESIEAVSSGLIILKLLTPLMASEPENIPKMFGTADQRLNLPAPGDGEMALILVMSPSCFTSPDYLIGLCQMCIWRVNHVLPVVTFENFAFPTAGFYMRLEVVISQMCEHAGIVQQPKVLHNYVQAIFKKICSRLNVLGSQEIMEVQAAVVNRSLNDRARLALDMQEEAEESLMAMSQIATYCRAFDITGTLQDMLNARSTSQSQTIPQVSQGRSSTGLDITGEPATRSQNLGIFGSEDAPSDFCSRLQSI